MHLYISIDKNSDYKSVKQLKTNYWRKMQLSGQCVVWSQLNYEGKNQLFIDKAGYKTILIY